VRKWVRVGVGEAMTSLRSSPTLTCEGPVLNDASRHRVIEYACSCVSLWNHPVRPEKEPPLIRTRFGHTALLVFALSAAVASLGAQETVGHSRLDLRLGTRFTSRTSTSPTGVVKTTEAGAVQPSIGVAHWFRNRLALTTTATLLWAKVDEDSGGSNWRTKKAFSVPLLVGLRYFMPRATERSRWRPWASAEAGPMIGIEVTSSEDRYGGGSRTALGARIAFGARGGFGLDLRLGDSVTLVGSAGYLLVPGFLDRGGNQDNLGGLDLGITAGLSLN
jgi:hypothetical protein